jgi:multidrug resistance efflux pump
MSSPITPQAAGTVVSIAADDGMKVDAGQVLVQLDPNDARVAYEQAVANLANTVRQVRGLYSTVEAGQADLAARQRAGREGARRRAAPRRPGRHRRGVRGGAGACAR